jgi:hypothetical protein
MGDHHLADGSGGRVGPDVTVRAFEDSALDGDRLSPAS